MSEPTHTSGTHKSRSGTHTSGTHKSGSGTHTSGTHTSGSGTHTSGTHTSGTDWRFEFSKLTACSQLPGKHSPTPRANLKMINKGYELLKGVCVLLSATV